MNTKTAETAENELRQWREWAQFVYLQGGPVTLSDADLRAAVCKSHDAQVLEAEGDARYHRDCRPNRRQAEVWRDDAKAMNDKWADTEKARRGLQEIVDDLYTIFTSTPQEIARLFGESRCVDDSCRINYALELMDSYVSVLTRQEQGKP